MTKTINCLQMEQDASHFFKLEKGFVDLLALEKFKSLLTIHFCLSYSLSNLFSKAKGTSLELLIIFKKQ
jgi:hypothetical protein